MYIGSVPYSGAYGKSSPTSALQVELRLSDGVLGAPQYALIFGKAPPALLRGGLRTQGHQSPWVDEQLLVLDEI